MEIRVDIAQPFGAPGGPPDEYTSVPALLTDEHASSSYGQPVVVVDGDAYGPADLPRTLHPEGGDTLTQGPGAHGSNEIREWIVQMKDLIARWNAAVVRSRES